MNDSGSSRDFEQADAQSQAVHQTNLREAALEVSSVSATKFKTNSEWRFDNQIADCCCWNKVANEVNEKRTKKITKKGSMLTCISEADSAPRLDHQESSPQNNSTPNGAEEDGAEECQDSKQEEQSNKSEPKTLECSPVKSQILQFEMPESCKKGLFTSEPKYVIKLTELATRQESKTSIQNERGANQIGNKTSQRLKTCLRAFKKHILKDFGCFEKSCKKLSTNSELSFWDTMTLYLQKKGLLSEYPTFNHAQLALILNPKKAMKSWKHVSSLTTDRNEWNFRQPILVQDLLFKFSLQKAKEFMNIEENRLLFAYFASEVSHQVAQFNDDVNTLKSL